MAFELKNTVPWGRNLDEYSKMFGLTASDLNSRIISFGDGPASFNAEMTANGKSVTSLDLVYQFSDKELAARIAEVKDTIMQQLRDNQDNFVWTTFKNPDELEAARMGAMHNFIADFEKGKAEQRYIYHELPEQTSFAKQAFDLGLSSHFLMLYPY